MVTIPKRRRRREAGVGEAIRLGRHADPDTGTPELQRQLDSDVERESRIDMLGLQFSAARDPERRRDLWEQLKVARDARQRTREVPR